MHSVCVCVYAHTVGRALIKHTEPIPPVCSCCAESPACTLVSCPLTRHRAPAPLHCMATVLVRFFHPCLHGYNNFQTGFPSLFSHASSLSPQPVPKAMLRALCTEPNCPTCTEGRSTNNSRLPSNRSPISSSPDSQIQHCRHRV